MKITGVYMTFGDVMFIIWSFIALTIALLILTIGFIINIIKGRKNE